MITYRDGFVYAALERPLLAVNVVDDTGTFPFGPIAGRWPKARTTYLNWFQRDASSAGAPFELGEVEFVTVEPNVRVANLLAQHGLATSGNPHPLDLDAFADTLTRVAVAATATPDLTVAVPRINDIADWGEVEPIVFDALGGLTVTVYRGTGR